MSKPIGLQQKLSKSDTKQSRFIPYSCQQIDDQDIQAVIDILRSRFLTQGPKVAEFERELCGHLGAQFAVAVNSGTSALHIACLAASVEPGDEVITSPISFVASANCAIYCGARPIFADIDPKTYNLSPKDLESRITSKTKAIIPVHFAGQSCDMKLISQIAKAAEQKFGHRIYIIEDASHALGSRYQNQPVGSCSFSDMSVMSFHPVKHITTGEGGVVLTNDSELYQCLKRYRSHGITSDKDEFVNQVLAFDENDPNSVNPWYYEQQCLGYNYRLTDIQCALGISQLQKLPRFIKRRREIVDEYNLQLKNTNHIQTPYESSDCRSNFHLYTLLFDFSGIGMSRAQLIKRLKERGVQTQVHYIPIHLQPFYQKRFGTKQGQFPFAEEYYRKCLSVPLFPGLSNEDVEWVVSEIKSIIKNHQ